MLASYGCVLMPPCILFDIFDVVKQIAERNPLNHLTKYW